MEVENIDFFIEGIYRSYFTLGKQLFDLILSIPNTFTKRAIHLRLPVVFRCRFGGHSTPKQYALAF
jgi:hypothetical protein